MPVSKVVSFFARLICQVPGFIDLEKDYPQYNRTFCRYHFLSTTYKYQACLISQMGLNGREVFFVIGSRGNIRWLIWNLIFGITASTIRAEEYCRTFDLD